MKLIRRIKGNGEGPKVAVLGCVHGNENYSLKVFKKLKNLLLLKGEIDFYLVNDVAFNNKERFVDSDLNRSFNSDLDGYEYLLSKKIVDVLNSYDYVIDMHSTVSKSNPFLIVTNKNLLFKEFLRSFHIKKIVYIEDLEKRSLISNFENAASIEISSLNYKSAIKNGVKYIMTFLRNNNFIKNVNLIENNFENEYYEVVGKYDNCFDRNFKFVFKNNKRVCPIMNGEMAYENKIGFKAVRIYK